MTKEKPNDVVYHVLSHHIDHYIQAKKIFKTDYDSHMITITVFAHFLYGTLNPSHKIYQHKDLEWGEMYPLVKGLSKSNKKYVMRLSLYSISQILDMPKETVRRKVDALCKNKMLEYSVKDGLSIGDNFESLAKKISPKDLLSMNKAIMAIDKNGGVSKILKNMTKTNK